MFLLQSQCCNQLSLVFMSQKTSVMTGTGFTLGQPPVLSGRSTVNILVVDSQNIFTLFS